MTLNLYRYVPKKARAGLFAGITALIGCGDTYETYVTSGGESAPQKVEINSCEDWAARNYQCNPQAYIDYLNDWGQSIEDQLKHDVYECNKGDWFKNAPGIITCYEEHDCDYIKAGNCSHYFTDAGF